MFGIHSVAGSLTCWAIFGGSLLATHLALYLLAALRRKQAAHPNATPDLLGQLGGLAILLPFVVVCLLCLFRATPFMTSVSAPNSQILTLLLCVVLVAALGVVVTARAVAFRLQLLVQISLAALICLAGPAIATIDLPILGLRQVGPAGSVLLTVVWIVAFTNSLRLLDGLDRLSSSVAFGCLMTLAMISSLNISTLVILLSLSLAGGTLGLMLFNLNPVQFQLGWAGRYLLGFSIGAITLMGAHKTTGVLLYWIPLLLLAFQIPQFYIQRASARRTPTASPHADNLLHSALLRLIVAATVASVSYAVFEAGGAQKSWWFTGKSKYILIGTIFGITWLAMNLRPVRRAWVRHRTRLLLVALARFFREQMTRHSNYRTANSLLAIAQEELGLAGLEITCATAEGPTRVFGFRPQYHLQAPAPFPTQQFSVATASDTQLTVRVHFAYSANEEDQQQCRQWLQDVLSHWPPTLPVATPAAEEAQAWPRDAEDCLAFPTPDILGQWKGMKSQISL